VSKTTIMVPIISSFTRNPNFARSFNANRREAYNSDRRFVVSASGVEMVLRCLIVSVWAQAWQVRRVCTADDFNMIDNHYYHVADALTSPRP